jgi:hypothetical protein
MNIQQWLEQMRSLIQELQTIDLGYPQGENTIYPPNEDLLQEMIIETNLDQNCPLVDLYRHCNGINLPDVHNGYFVHRLEIILRGLKNGEPTKTTGYKATLTDIVVFGTDGGGGRLALVKDDPQEVLYLSTGILENSVFDCSPTQCEIVSPDFPGFLKRLQSDVEAFIEDRDNWSYIGS